MSIFIDLVFILLGLSSYIFYNPKKNKVFDKLTTVISSTIYYNVISLTIVYILPIFMANFNINKANIIVTFLCYGLTILCPYLVLLLGNKLFIKGTKCDSKLTIESMNFIYLITLLSALIAFLFFAIKSSGGVTINEDPENYAALYQCLFSPLALIIASVFPLNIMFTSKNRLIQYKEALMNSYKPQHHLIAWITIPFNILIAASLIFFDPSIQIITFKRLAFLFSGIIIIGILCVYYSKKAQNK